jgi:cyclopropane fatty-acyl-phospholipid synthase-like methyltransferase
MPDMDKGRIAEYYDRNTRMFLRIGASSSALALHRGLWDADTRDAAAAADAVHALLAAHATELLGRAPTCILDLGCGVGGSAFALLSRYPEARAVGVTLSAAQVALARGHAQRLGLSDRAAFAQADFETLDAATAGGEHFDLVIAIEALAHASDAAAALGAARRLMRPGEGLLLVVDDMLAPATASRAQRIHIERLRNGWHLPGLHTAAEWRLLAQTQSLDACLDLDLTPRIRTRRPRDWLVRALAPLLRTLRVTHPFAGNLCGGAALSRAIELGAIEYRLLGFVPRATSHPGSTPSI